MSVTSENGFSVSGWLVGNDERTVSVAINDELDDIRLIRNVQSISYEHERINPRLQLNNAGQIESDIDEVNSQIVDPTRRAISRINFGRLHYFGHRSLEVRRQIDLNEYNYFYERGSRSERLRDRRRDSESRDYVREDLTDFLAAQVDRSTSLHYEVYDTFEESGLADILSEFGPRLAILPPEFTLPAYDLDFESESELISSLESSRENLWSVARHRASISSIEVTRARLITEISPVASDKIQSVPEKVGDANFFSRWAAPSLRVLAGTGLATANVAVGLTAGLTGSIATIGATAVPTYVGVLTSIYTGLVQVADGLEKIGRNK